MTRIRRGPVAADNFTILANSQIRDEALTWGARGLLAWMNSHREGFEITEDEIIAAGPSGRDGVRSMIRELEQAGYLRRERTPIVTGGSSVDYVLTDPRGTENPSLGRVGESDPRADQAKHDSPESESAGQSTSTPTDGKSVPRSLSEEQKKTKTPSESLRASRSTATRIPENFQPTDEMRAWYAEEKLEQVIDGRTEHAKFVDYWLGCPGTKGRKVDWPATWRNWMRTAAERAGRRPGNGLAVPTSGVPAYRPSTTDQRVAQGMALAEKYRAMEEAGEL